MYLLKGYFMKKLFFILFLGGILNSANFNITGFSTDLYSKNNTNMKKIIMDLEIFTPNEANESAIKDAINVIISSFYAEDLLSSKGKEAFKDAIKKYALSKHKISISEIYILGLKTADEVDISKLIKLVEEHYKKQDLAPKTLENAEIYPNQEANKLIEEQMKATSKMLDDVKDFGDVDFYRQ